MSAEQRRLARGASARSLGLIRPWRGQLALTFVLGIARVAAFIGVGVLGALVVRRGQGRRAVRHAALAPCSWWRRSPGCCTGSNRGWRTTWRTACSPRCASRSSGSSKRWRPPISRGAARATWSGSRPRTSRRSSTSSPTRSRRRSSRCWCRPRCWCRSPRSAGRSALALVPFLAVRGARAGARRARDRSAGLARARGLAAS